MMDIRQQFPLLSGGDIAYLDSAATSQKPRVVLDAMTRFYERDYANVNRGVHALAEAATAAYDDARASVRSFINAEKAHEVIFTRGTTEAINLAARSWGDAHIKEGDTIILSILEHHSNIVPWQQLCERTGARIEWIDIDEEGNLRLDDFEKKLAAGSCKLAAVTGVSNVLGTVTPLKDIVALVHEAGALVLVDAAQLAPHHAIDVQDLDCDFLAFSGHKIYGPTGIGVLYAKEKILENMPPFLGGGDMIQTVTTGGFTPAELPRKFEAGTPPIAEAVGLHAAITWMSNIGINEIAAHEREILGYAFSQLAARSSQLTILGPKDSSKIASCISFVANGIHPHDLTQMLSDRGVMLRAGHHCTQPLHARLGIPASTRLSVAAYTTKEDIDRACAALEDSFIAWQA